MHNKFLTSGDMSLDDLITWHVENLKQHGQMPAELTIVTVALFEQDGMLEVVVTMSNGRDLQLDIPLNRVTKLSLH